MDTMTPEQRHRVMVANKSKDTKPEVAVRRLLHALGYRFRIHRKDLPGKPDIVLPKHRTVIFVHGCFWHHHEGCKAASTPASNIDFWQTKFRRNQERDAQVKAQLESMGWKVIVIWECEVKRILSERAIPGLRAGSVVPAYNCDEEDEAVLEAAEAERE